MKHARTIRAGGRAQITSVNSIAIYMRTELPSARSERSEQALMAELFKCLTPIFIQFRNIYSARSSGKNYVSTLDEIVKVYTNVSEYYNSEIIKNKSVLINRNKKLAI